VSPLSPILKRMRLVLAHGQAAYVSTVIAATGVRGERASKRPVGAVYGTYDSADTEV